MSKTYNVGKCADFPNRLVRKIVQENLDHLSIVQIGLGLFFDFQKFGLRFTPLIPTYIYVLISLKRSSMKKDCLMVVCDMKGQIKVKFFDHICRCDRGVCVQSLILFLASTKRLGSGRGWASELPVLTRSGDIVRIKSRFD